MRIAVAGVGYVGLSLAVLLAQHNQVKAVDIIPEKADIVNKGKSPIQDTELEDYLANRINLGENYIPGLYATVDAIKAYKDAEIVIVAAPTNYDIVEEYFDTSAVENVIETVLSANKDALIVIKSTVPVGFTDSVRERFKTKNIIFSPEFLRESHALYDNLLPSMKTNWGGYSLVECELRLLETALQNGDYSFIHLLSGQDLPIKPIEEILSFFDSHEKYNFIYFDLPKESKKREEYVYVKYYYPFLEYKRQGRRTVWSISQRIAVEIQKILNVNRTKNFKGRFKSGSQWWSISSELARYIVSERILIRRLFEHTMSDEMFMQTLVFNSPKYYETLYKKECDDLRGNQRMIVFEKGHPHIWTIKEIDKLKHSDLLFARKFDDSVDKEAIQKIIETCK